MIKVENLSFIYNQGKENEILALQGINFKINEGEFVAIIGPNASGKSTLAKCIGGILIPSTGKVFIDGLDTTSFEAKWKIHQMVSIVFTDPETQLIGPTVEEDVAFGLWNIGLDPPLIEKRVDEALKAIGMEEYRNFPIHLLSSGEKQLVVIAGALAFRPKYLILDGAMSFLDPRKREELIILLQRLNNEGLTILLITHKMDEVLLAKRVIVMNKGRKLIEGLPLEVFNRQEVKGLGIFPPINRCLKESGLIFKKEIDESRDKTTSILKIEGLNFAYNKRTKVWALKDIDLEIKEGESLGLIGPTGSGKTTLIQQIANLLQPTSGRVYVKEKVGVVFQSPEDQLFGRTVYEDIIFGCKDLDRSLAQIEERIHSALKVVGLSKDILFRPPYSLSDGERRLVAIAATLIHKPKILALDGPTLGLDPTMARRVLQGIKGLNINEGVTIILISNQIDEILEFCNRIIVLDKGRIIFNGPSLQVFTEKIEVLTKIGFYPSSLERPLNSTKQQ